MMRLVQVLVIGLLMGGALAYPEQGHAVPGGIAVIDVPESWHEPVTYQGASVLVHTDANGQRRAYVGISIWSPPGEQVLLDRRQSSLRFEVGEASYPESRISITEERFVSPEPIDRDRIAAEQVKINAARASRRAAPQSLWLEWPAEGPVSSVYGARRFINDIPSSPHRGLDIAIPTGTPLRAVSGGTVALVGDLFYTGHTIMVDHGGGLISMYAHMSEPRVTEGQVLQAGDVIGLSGATGRVTGPHLHLGLSLNGQLIDPQLLLMEQEREVSSSVSP